MSCVDGEVENGVVGCRFRRKGRRQTSLSFCQYVRVFFLPKLVHHDVHAFFLPKLVMWRAKKIRN